MGERFGTPLQNRVDPTGALHSIEDRGTWMGNRGALHNTQRKIIHQWKRTAWITCRLEFNGKKQEVFARGKDSQLFFLDEATAFSAGHRPCNMCRSKDYKAFKSAWLTANPGRSATGSFRELDECLHAERVDPSGGKITFTAEIGELPEGTFVEIEGAPHLLWHGHCFAWSFAGYRAAMSRCPSTMPVRVLTPASVVGVFRSGLRPEVHRSVGL